MNILGIIPARGGSKGIPRKNLAPLSGTPLLAYTAEAALGAKSLSRVILSTDDEEIASVGRELGLEVPFIRPAKLAQDDSPTIDVITHALATMSSDAASVDAVCLLQPTAPLRTSALIDDACQTFVREGVDTLISVSAIPHHHHPDWALVPLADGTLRWANGQQQPPARRQDLPPAFHRDGTIYITRIRVINSNESLYGKTIFGYDVGSPNQVNIDSFDDLAKAERLLAERDARCRSSLKEECSP